MTIEDNYNVCSVCGEFHDHGTLMEENFVCLDCLENNEKAVREWRKKMKHKE